MSKNTAKPRKAKAASAAAKKAPLPRTRGADGLTPQQSKFVRAYVVSRNATQAAIEAGYSKATAVVQGSRLLTKVEVKKAVETATAEVTAKVAVNMGISLERTLREIARIGYFDPRRMFKADGTPLAIHQLDDDTAAAIAGLDVQEVYEGSGEDRRLVGEIKKWKLADKKGALDMLMKHLGGYSEDNRQRTDPLIALLDGMRRSAVPVVATPPQDDA